MTQQVNLLNRALIRPRDWLSLNNMMMIYALTLAGMVWLYNYTLSQMETAQEKRNQAVAEFESLQKELQAVTNAQAKPINAESQEKELQALMQKRAMQDKVLTVFRQVEKDGHHHILDYMQGFAHQKMQDVWLTGFKIDPFVRSLSLTGKALNAELIPTFISHLSGEPVFKGQLFGGLTIKSAEQADSRQKTPAAAAADPVAQGKPDANVKVAVPVPLVEFEVKGMEQQSLGQTPPTAEPNNADDTIQKMRTLTHG